jgi:hypothetical protein
MIARRLILATLVCVCALAGALAIGGESAQAEVLHDYLSHITEVPVSSGAPLTGPVSGAGAMTVDSGHLWVAESEGPRNNRVDELDAATGAFISQLPQVPSLSYLDQGVAVAHGTGDVYVGGDEFVAGVPEGVVAVFSAAGSLLGVWTGADTPGATKGFDCFACAGSGGVAVDNSLIDPAAGDVYVSSPELRVVDVFKKPEANGKEPLEANVAQLKGTCPVAGTTCEEGEVIPFTGPTSVAVDASTGDVLVLDGNVVDVFRPELLGGYEFVRSITGTPEGPFGSSFGSVHDLAVDGSSGEVYVAAGSSPNSLVDQFSSAGVYLGRITGVENTPAGNFSSVESVAVDPESRHVFVGDSRGGEEPPQPSAIDVFGGDLVIPDVATGAAVSVMPRGATLTGTVKLDKEGEATCLFVWGTSEEFGQSAPCSAPAKEEESAVQATLGQATGSELQPDTTYFYRLQATNKNGTNPGESSQDQHFTTKGPGIRGESVSEVASTSVTFDATIDPDNSPTTYYFQYGTSGVYEASVPAPPGLSLGSGKGDVEAVPQHVQGLAADTVYHYRVVTISEPTTGHFEEFDGPDQTFTTQTAGAFALPDGRSWEMVSPPEKNGALIEPIGVESPIQAAADGAAITYSTNTPTEAEPQGYGSGLQVLSVRGGVDAPSWGSRDIAIPHIASTGVGAGRGAEYRFFSEDLSLGVVQPFGTLGPSLSEEASEQTAFVRTDFLGGNVEEPCLPATMHCYRPLVTAKNATSGNPFGEESKCTKGNVICGPEFVGATPDLSHVVFQSGVVLIAGSAANLYEWADGKLTAIGAGELGAAHSPTDGVGAARHAISDDGSHVFFSAADHLYMRDTATEKTLQIDAPEAGCLKEGKCGEGEVGAEFQLASSDGSRVFFTDTQSLTPEAHAYPAPRGNGGSSGGSDLYVCEIHEDVCHLKDIAPSGAVLGSMLGASEDGSWVYFVANGVLQNGGAPVPGAVHGSCGDLIGRGASPVCNLYVRHDGTTKLVSVLGEDDSSDWNAGLLGLPARVSPDGEWLAFMSQRSLTGYTNRDAVSGEPDEEVYLYNGGTERLACTSCDPTGARPHGVEYSGTNLSLVEGNKAWESTTWLAANVPGWSQYTLTDAIYQSRYLSNSGRLFFNSSDALVPRDVNGQEDVYEYEPEGVGSGGAPCGSGAASGSEVFKVARGFEVEGRRMEEGAGCVGLISSGTSGEESAFLDASETGGDVFFLTTSKLAPQDFDDAPDVYDAHECTSAAPCVATPTVPPPCVTAEGCRAAPVPQPAIFGAPSSATFSGFGNVAPSSSPVAAKGKGKPVKCRRGFVKRKSKCVRKPKAKKKARKSVKGRK